MRLTSFTNIITVLIAIIWCFLHIWRKPFSYIEMFGIYIIEWTVIISLIIFCIYIFFRFKFINIFSRLDYFSFALRVNLIFVVYSLLIAILFARINPLALIPIVYVAYLPIIYLIFKESNLWIRTHFLKIIIIFYVLTPILFYGFRSFLFQEFTNILPDTDDAGWTFSYGVALTACLTLIKRKFLAYVAFFVCLLGAIALFQRGAILCFMISYVLIFLTNHSNNKYKELFVEIMILIVISIGAILIGSYFLNTFFSDSIRFELDLFSFGQFILSIFTSDVDLSGDSLGTRSHRIEMWLEIIDYNLQSITRFLFGNGFAGEVGDIIGISFRVPHNGFITIFYRTGIIGVFFFLIFLMSLARSFIRFYPKDELSSNARTLGIILIGSFVGDCLTGTILDSPFTLFVFVVNICLVMTFFNNDKLKV